MSKKTKIPIELDRPFAELKLAFRIFKEHYKPFIGVFLLTIFGTIFIMITLSMLIVRILYIGLELDFDPAQLAKILIYSVQLPTTMIQIALIGSGWGLAFDIMASGDEFTQLKNAFTYFRKNWWRYLIIATIGAPNLFISLNKFYPIVTWIPNNSLISFFIYLGFDLLTYVWEIVIIMAFPSATAHKSLSFAIKENIRLVKNHFKKIFTSLFQLYIFLIPFTIYMEYYFYAASTALYTPGVLSAINWSIMVISLILFPISAALKPLIGTRVYLALTEVPPSNEGKNKIGIDPSLELDR